MSDELEAIGLAAAGSVARDIDGDGYLDGPCPNCGTLLKGEYCSHCGQSARDMHKPFVTLVSNALGDVFAFDGRIAKTLPGLMFRPGHVTRAYLEGKRARYVPPFRLFLIASVLFFLVLFGLVEGQDWLDGDDLTVSSSRTAIEAVRVDGQRIDEIPGFEQVFDAEGNFSPDGAEAFIDGLAEVEGLQTPAERGELLTVLNGMNDISASRKELFAAIQTWTPRLSFLLVPFYVLALAFLHVWMRRVYVYDHVVVALHFQSFLYFGATAMILAAFVLPVWIWWIYGIGIPVYLYKIMRKSYGTSRILTVIRTFLMLIFSFVAIVLLITAISLVGANEAGLFSWDELMSDGESGPVQFNFSDD